MAAQGNDQTLYESNARTWWSPDGPFAMLNHLVPARFRFFDRYVADWPGVRVLDVGCGGGFVCEFLAKRGAEVTGLDPSRGLLSIARDHARDAALDIRYVEGAAERLPFGEGEFDAVVCVDVLEHVDHVPTALSEIARVLRPGGRLLYDTLNRTLFSRLVTISLLENVLGLVPKGTHDPRLYIRPQEMDAYLERAGFTGHDSVGLNPVGFDFKARAPRFGIGGGRHVLYAGTAIRT